jgi:hypothetical protein
MAKASSATPLSEHSAAIYFEAVIAAILTTAAVGVMNPTPENLIAKHKEMLQKLRAAGGPFN